MKIKILRFLKLAKDKIKSNFTFILIVVVFFISIFVYHINTEMIVIEGRFEEMCQDADTEELLYIVVKTDNQDRVKILSKVFEDGKPHSSLGRRVTYTVKKYSNQYEIIQRGDK